MAAILTVTLLGSSVTGAADIPEGLRRSGTSDLGQSLRAMQDDDMVNPATFWVLDGETLWGRKEGAAQRACGDCHGAAPASMKGVSARYPAFSTRLGRPVTLADQINVCRTEQQGAAALADDSRPALALSAYVGRQSRGEPIAAVTDARLQPFVEKGRRLFTTRMGQLNLSCAQCHDDNWGRHLGGALIPQGHPTGYPVYRLEWQGLGSLQRRLRNCFAGMRAELPAPEADDYVSLELFLRQRAQGLVVETPAVRP